MIVPLISEELFRENSPIKTDTGVDDFIPYITIAQKMYIEKILGIPLTVELQDQIKANDLTPDNRALIIEIAAPLSMYAVYQGLPFHWASILNKGLTLRESENSKAVDVQTLGWLSRRLKDNAEQTARFLVEYLCSCRDKYPLWRPSRGYGCSDDCSGAGEGSNSVPLDGSIFIPKRR